MRAEAEFRVEMFTPAYLAPGVKEDLARRAAEAAASLEACMACPRKCGVDRTGGELGVCRTGRAARVCSAFPHTGEESCLVGTRGSGTIFFARCNLRCVFCQNWDISQAESGEPMTAEQIADLMLALQNRGCHNINFVTPEHDVPQVIEAIARAAGRGLNVPIVYNTSAYDSVESIRTLDGLIDIYMPDIKLFDRDLCATYLRADDYAERAREAVLEMHRQVGDLHMRPDGTACRGLLARHLVMPGLLDDSRAIFEWLAREVSPDTFINIMGQYHPAHQVGRRETGGGIRHEAINRRPTPIEIRRSYELAREAGLWRFDE